MKVLLDENLDVRFKREFAGTGHDVFTVRELNWNGIKNGKLLALMEQNGFDVLICVDKNLPYQQNLRTLPVTIFVLDVWRNTLFNVKLLVPRLLEQMRKPLEKEVIILK